MLLRRSCSSSKPTGFFCKSKALHTTYHLKSSTPSTRDSCTIPCHETLTLLRKTIKFLPRALPSAVRHNLSSPTESFEFWNDILAGAYRDLTSEVGRPARIAVCGFGEFSGAQDLVTALLEEPLSSDQTQNDCIRSRWKDRSESIILTITNSASSQPSTLVTQSAYLRQFTVPVNITEVSAITRSAHRDGSPTINIDEVAARVLLQADAAIILCNPFTTPLPTLFQTPLPTKNPNTILILSYTSLPASESPTMLLSRFTRPHEPAFQGREILFIDPARALSANETIKGNPRSPAAIQRYQDDYTSSNVSTLTTALKAVLSPNSKSLWGSLPKQTALAQLQGALDTCRSSLEKARSEMEEVSMAVSQLNGRMEEAQVKARGEVLGQPDLAKSNMVGDIVSVALKDAKQEMRQAMDRLTWWRMVLRVDEISTIVNQTLQRSWCRNLEKQLIMQTGRLSALQRDITNSTFSLLSMHATPPFKSAVLENTLNQLKSSQAYSLTPQTLSRPIFSRSAQIVQYPTVSLHVAGQRAVLGMTGGIMGGVGLGWAGWVGWLVGSGEGLLGMIGIDAGTAIGVGLLGTTIAVRWAVGTWERSKRRWWEDWSRVGDGLDRDLKDTLDKTMQEKILVVGRAGCGSLSEMISKRREEIELIEEDLQTLHKELKRLET